MTTPEYFKPCSCAMTAPQLSFEFIDNASKTMPVELLRGRQGIYGVGIPGLSRTARRYEDAPNGALILRPDRLEGTKPCGAVLQKISGGFRRSIFCHSIEEQLRRFIHHEALRRAGLSWPPRSKYEDPPWWSANKKQQAQNRRTYHGLRLLSLQVINRLIGEALQAVDADAIKAARQFAFRHREHIYRASARSRRALQLTDTFPVLAVAIYSDRRPLLGLEWNCDPKSAAALVQRGARLREVAAAMGIPMALRCIKPGAAHLTPYVLCQHSQLLRVMPEALPRSRIWLLSVGWALEKVGPYFAEWVARNVSQIPGNVEQVISFLSNIADWMRAGTPDWLEPQARGRQFVVRAFTPSMSLKTVTRLSADWHEAVASHMDGPEFAFPPPWYPAAKLGTYEILPIDNSAALYREGAAMHHCVGTYADDVKYGGLYIYSVRRDGERLATLALARDGRDAASLIQIRGPCNAEAPKEIVSTVWRWLRAQPPLPPPTPQDQIPWWSTP